MDGMHRIVVSGKNSALSHTAAQDAARKPAAQDDPLFNGYFHSHHASTLFIRAYALRNEPELRDHYHRLAMAELDELAKALGLELVPIKDVVTR